MANLKIIVVVVVVEEVILFCDDVVPGKEFVSNIGVI